MVKQWREGEAEAGPRRNFWGKYFEVSFIFRYFACDIREKQYINQTIAMLKYLGILLIVIGAVVLLVSYFMEWVDYNPVQFCGLGLIIIGLVGHILLQKYIK